MLAWIIYDDNDLITNVYNLEWLYIVMTMVWGKDHKSIVNAWYIDMTQHLKDNIWWRVYICVCDATTQKCRGCEYAIG